MNLIETVPDLAAEEPFQFLRCSNAICGYAASKPSVAPVRFARVAAPPQATWPLSLGLK